LRKDFDEAVKVQNRDHKGVVYRKGKIVQVWWETTIGGYTGPETWVGPNIENAVTNFIDMVERWNED